MADKAPSALIQEAVDAILKKESKAIDNWIIESLAAAGFQHRTDKIPDGEEHRLFIRGSQCGATLIVRRKINGAKITSTISKREE